MRIQVLSIACDVISFNGQGQLCQPTCRVKRSFKPYQNDHNSVKDTQEKGKKPCHIDHENLVPLPTYLSFLKTFPTKMKPSKCPAREKKMRHEKPKRRGREKEKSKSQDCCVPFQPKTCIKILLSAHARTSQANGLHLDQKAAKCTTCKRLCGKF